MTAPANLRILRANGDITPLEVEFIGTEPMELLGDIRVIDRYRVTTETFMSEGDRIDGDIPDGCSVIVNHLGVRNA